MTSKEIKELGTGVEIIFWLKEIAYQLAVMNERAGRTERYKEFDRQREP